MAVQHSDAVRNARLNATETTIGTSPAMKWRTGAQPANCAAADSGTLLATLTLPSDWQAAASGGTKAKSGTWEGTASATGTVGHYRIYSSGGTCHEQGSVGTSSADLIVSSTSVTSGETMTINTAVYTEGNV